MKKRVFLGTLACIMLSIGLIASANPKINLIINGKEINTGKSIKIEGGRVMVPVRTIAEALGATVNWDKKSKTVTVTSNNTAVNDLQVKLLEQAIAPEDPLTAVKTWAEALKTRNGALQYAVLSEDQKKLRLKEFTDLNWVTGASSPWIDAYDIIEKGKLDDNTYIYGIDYTYTDSTRSNFHSFENIIVKRYNENWFIYDEEVIEAKGKINDITIGDDGKVVSFSIEDDSSVKASYDKANVIIGNDTKIFKGYTNKQISAKDLEKDNSVEVTFVEGPRIMIYPVSAVAKTIRVID